MPMGTIRRSSWSNQGRATSLDRGSRPKAVVISSKQKKIVGEQG
jgi:hypothetical protein